MPDSDHDLLDPPGHEPRPEPVPDAAQASGVHRELGLTDSEYDDIVAILGREPSATELAMYSVMWSEHCSYKSSRPHLRRLPSDGEHVILGPGENAGVIDIGDGMAAVMRIESHNHPSFVEPYQGAATGVGGILRDILTMGARPIACFDSLRFGLPYGSETPAGPQADDAAKQRWLARGVVAGVGGYGNSVGVPTLGGELVFDPCYDGNPLVNVMCVGVMPVEQIQRSAATGKGNVALLIGASTGRDGIGGVSILASASFEDGDEAKRPSVQVGDPFEEKKLIEACLELFERGLTVAVQDLGGAGLTCATSETAAGGGAGMDVDIAAVLRREENMSAVEVLTSESQERMFVVVEPEDVDEALSICAKWDSPAVVLGTIADSGRLRITDGDSGLVCDVPPESLADGIVYDRPLERPKRVTELAALDPDTALPDVADSEAAKELVALMGSPNLADQSWAWRQYDHQLFLNTVVGPGADACVLRVKNTSRALAVSVDCVGRYGRLDPRRGAELAVAEACRNVAVVGARPKAVVDCLNFGNPERPDVMWEFSEAVDGIAQACDALGVPVVGGNVSFYNETNAQSIDPTPTIGVVGLIDNLDAVPTGPGFARDGDGVYVLGTTRDDLGASEWAWWRHGFVGGSAPHLDLAAEQRLIDLLIELQARKTVSSVHDVSTGGVAAALAECALAGGIGAEVQPSSWAPGLSTAAALFSETSGRAVCSVAPQSRDQFLDSAARHDVVVFEAGLVGGNAVLGASISELRAAVNVEL